MYCVEIRHEPGRDCKDGRTVDTRLEVRLDVGRGIGQVALARDEVVNVAVLPLEDAVEIPKGLTENLRDHLSRRTLA